MATAPSGKLIQNAHRLCVNSDEADDQSSSVVLSLPSGVFGKEAA